MTRARRGRPAPMLAASAIAAIALGLMSVACSNSPAADPAPATVGSIPTDEPTVGPQDVELRWVDGGGPVGDALFYLPKEREQRLSVTAIVVPGWMGRWDSVAWIGPQLASRGIPTLQLEIEEAGSDVALRAEATAQAIDRLRTDPALANEAASTEVVVIGHSMGGGAALELSAKGSIDGAVALAPFTPDPPPSAMLAPTVVLSCHDDSMTPIAQHTAPVVNAEHHAGFFWADIANTNHDCPTNRPHDWRLTGFLTTTIVDFIATLTDPEGSDSDAFCRAFERAGEDPEPVELSATLCEPPPG